MATEGGTSGIGSISPTRNSRIIKASTRSESTQNRRCFNGGMGSSAGTGRWMCQISFMSQGRTGIRTRTESNPPRLTRSRYWMKVIPMELPTRKVAGSPTRVNRPAELLMMAVRMTGGMKSRSRSWHTLMTTGAISITMVALGRNAQRGAVRTISPKRKRLPLPRVASRKRTLNCSKSPVGTRVRATTMPPNRSEMEPPAVCAACRNSSRVKTPKSSMTLTPSIAASTKSSRFRAMERMTPPKTRRVTATCKSLMVVPPES